MNFNRRRNFKERFQINTKDFCLVQKGEILSPAKLLDEFNPLPSNRTQKTMDFFFLPYSPNQERAKHMNFADTSTSDFFDSINWNYLIYLSKKGDKEWEKEIVEYIQHLKSAQFQHYKTKGWMQMMKLIFNAKPELFEHIANSI